VIRVLLADDQEMVRTGFRLILSAEDGIEVVGEAGTGVDAVARARALRPDVVLMDIRMPELDGLEATRVLNTDPDPPRIARFLLGTHPTTLERIGLARAFGER